jgi:hypothetical protein
LGFKGRANKGAVRHALSLVHSFAKLVTKLLALRLAPRMPELIGRNQSAFTEGRCIQDNFVLVRQSAVLLHQRKVPAVLLKLDVARAFDSVSWPFLLSILRQRGFGPRWIGWITLMLRSASTQVLINSSAGCAFLHARGLRQGDPLSPLLFVLVMDVKLVRPGVRRTRSVQQGLADAAWVRDISGELYPSTPQSSSSGSRPRCREFPPAWGRIALSGSGRPTALPRRNRCTGSSFMGGLPCRTMGRPILFIPV